MSASTTNGTGWRQRFDTLARRRRNDARRRGGFTIIEVMIAMLIFIIGATGLIGLQLSTLRNSQFVKHADVAMLLIEDKLEELAAVPAINIQGEWEVVDQHGNQDSNGDYYRSTSVSPNDAMIRVEVRVYWYEKGTEYKDIEMVTHRRIGL